MLASLRRRLLLTVGLRENELLLQGRLEVRRLLPLHLPLARYILQEADGVHVVVDAAQDVFNALRAAVLLQLVHEGVHVKGACREEGT